MNAPLPRHWSLLRLDETRQQFLTAWLNVLRDASIDSLVKVQEADATVSNVRQLATLHGVPEPVVLPDGTELRPMTGEPDAAALGKAEAALARRCDDA
jgi:hypothetical protein